MTAAEWGEAFDGPEPGTPHNEAREAILEALIGTLIDKHDDEAPTEALHRSLRHNRELLTTLNRAWPLIEAEELIGDLWSVPAYLRRCAPWLSPDDVHRLHRSPAAAWTLSDLPLLDAARHRLGDQTASRRQLQRSAVVAARQGLMAGVIADLIESDDSELAVMSMLRGQDLRDALIDEDELPAADRDQLAGPFAHIVVDEAQELTDAQWQMLLLRCPSRSFTIVGDRAQARHGFIESWRERLERVGFGGIREAGLSINYRTPVEIMAAAEPVIRAVLPDANVPISVRSTGMPVQHGHRSALASILDDWLAGNADGTACVIGDARLHRRPACAVVDPGAGQGSRVRPGRAHRSGYLGRGHRGRCRPVCGDDQGDPQARHPDCRRSAAPLAAAAGRPRPTARPRLR